MYRAFKIHRFDKFIEYCGDGYFERMKGESTKQLLLRFDQALVAYDESWDDITKDESEDE